MPSKHARSSGQSRTIKTEVSDRALSLVAKPKGNDIPEALKRFDSLPDSANVRQPVVEGLYSCSATTVWRWVRAGIIPKPRKLGGITTWNVGELRGALAGEDSK